MSMNVNPVALITLIIISMMAAIAALAAIGSKLYGFIEERRLSKLYAKMTAKMTEAAALPKASEYQYVSTFENSDGVASNVYRTANSQALDDNSEFLEVKGPSVKKPRAKSKAKKTTRKPKKS